MAADDDQLYPLAEVLRVTSVSRSTLYRLIEKGDFPKPVKVGDRTIRWRKSEIQKWISEQKNAA